MKGHSEWSCNKNGYSPDEDIAFAKIVINTRAVWRESRSRLVVRVLSITYNASENYVKAESSSK